jgi:DHA2 family multidrug resistance protein
MSAASAPGLRGPITAALLLATFMNTIDATVVNTALPVMQGALLASPDQITWVLTSFILASAVMMPISGWLAARVGLKPMLLTCVALFTLTSLMCGVAASLPQMVLFRVLQGISGAAVAPLTQAVLLNINPPERFGRVMALFTMATVMGPILGPVLGGFITDQLDWRWCFYINLPTGVVSLILLWAFLPNEASPSRPFDFLGYGSLATGLASLQLVLDRGTSQDWFSSREIWIEAIVAAAAFWVFLTHTLTARHPLFDRRLARDRNFVTANILIMFFVTQLLASTALLPLLTQGVLGYPVMLSALVSMPRAIMIMAVLQVIGRLDAMVDRRLLLGVGLAVTATSFWLMAQFDLDMGPRTIVIAGAIQGLGQGFISVPLATLALATLPPELRSEGSSIHNLLRTMSASVGIAVVQAFTFLNGQRMHAALAEHVRPEDPVFGAGLPAALAPGTVEGALRLNDEITRQAAMVAYVDDFLLMGFATLCAAPLLLLLRQPRPGGAKLAAPAR